MLWSFLFRCLRFCIALALPFPFFVGTSHQGFLVLLVLSIVLELRKHTTSYHHLHLVDSAIVLFTVLFAFDGVTGGVSTYALLVWRTYRIAEIPWN